MHEAEAGNDKRVHSRHDVLVEGAVLAEGRWLACRIINLSAGGAKVAVEGPLAPGLSVQLRVGPLGQFDAVIAWRLGGEAGIKFSNAPSEMAELAMGLALYG